MNEEDRRKINSNRVYLLRNLDVSIVLLACLRSCKVLLQDHEDQINLLPTNAKRCAFLVDLIPKRGPEAFQHFMDALEESGQGHIRNQLIEGGYQADRNASLIRLKVDVRKSRGGQTFCCEGRVENYLTFEGPHVYLNIKTKTNP
ncbi:hypothetical protein HELRODRAFT_169612 [Helobdella robusta]|uniref:CARD domain-containing protein n=1 Tax=Helobdella robusta TaxID=6412 RepID=T1F260_HELRO|nr:hypothetical protein HELRODRAFT_169612 [Helobdella robusta]ESO07909.1 hypothetical protein HELRODRAFT_169612 [Helobdella robusta]